MIEFLSGSTYFAILLCVGLYMMGMAIQRRFRYAILNPMLISMGILIVFLVFTGTDYREFEQDVAPLSYLLTPATVSLAIPLYQQLEKLKRNWQAILLGILSGVLASAVSILAMAALFGFSHAEYVSALPKSITTAIGMVMSEELGGYPAITVGLIIVTGMMGNMFGEQLVKLLGLKDPIAKGIAMGTASHAFGTSRALQMGQLEGAMSGLSVAVAGLMTVVALQAFAGLL